MPLRVHSSSWVEIQVVESRSRRVEGKEESIEEETEARSTSDVPNL